MQWLLVVLVVVGTPVVARLAAATEVGHDETRLLVERVHNEELPSVSPAADDSGAAASSSCPINADLSSVSHGILHAGEQ